MSDKEYAAYLVGREDDRNWSNLGIKPPKRSYDADELRAYKRGLMSLC